MYKVFIFRKDDLNDATSFYVDIIINVLKENNEECEIVYSINQISKGDKVIVITLPAFLSVWKHNPKQDITIWFQGVVNSMLKYWPVPTAITVIAIAALVIYIQTPKGKYKFHYFKYTMPIFGKLIFLLDFSRILKAMLLNLRNGMRIQESIEVGKNVTNNYVMLSIIENSIKTEKVMSSRHHLFQYD